ncbi:hypothetical protein B5F08_11700 [Anaeromassilibacillus sp. An172]|nr:hypothetical protein B5F08_11700 [Anaeromassilibacillus sp. An172]
MDKNLNISISMFISPLLNKKWILQSEERKPELLLFYGHKVADKITETHWGVFVWISLKNFIMVICENNFTNKSTYI